MFDNRQNNRAPSCPRILRVRHGYGKHVNGESEPQGWTTSRSMVEEIVASDDNVPSGSRNLEEEVNAFLALPLQPLQSCPYTWWLSNKQVYPNIFDIALKYLSPPSSSVYSERVFSEAGNISSETRSRLAPHKVDDILFLHRNLPKLNFDYWS